MMPDHQFEEIIADAIDRLPKKYLDALDNVAITMADLPTPEQAHKLRLRCEYDLFGLYEGIPKTKRGNSYTGVLPDKITIFKLPIISRAKSFEDIQRQVRRTVWHEVAHHYGLDHGDIHRLEAKHI